MTATSPASRRARLQQLQQMADERRVRARTVWVWRLEGFARMALTARDPDRNQVAAEALKDLL
ncbi:hypothetical protein [Streptomyces sp. NPDC060022]|uniref:hypothetical protein n=1 Tax=Streptomyces sp. NPDC060022 TaxID=3347039 RepID=UPI0036A3515E